MNYILSIDSHHVTDSESSKKLVKRVLPHLLGEEGGDGGEVRNESEET